MLKSVLAAVAMLAVSALGASATDYYVAPQGTTLTCPASGTSACPWASFDAAFNSGKLKGGDRLNLVTGYYGALTINNRSYDPGLVIRAIDGQKPRVQKISIGNGTHNIKIKYLQVWADDPNADLGALISTSSGASDIVLQGLDVRAGGDATGFASWDQTTWLNRAVDGARLSSPRTTLRESTFTGTQFAITAMGPDITILSNVVNGYSGDGLRGQGNNGKFQGNRVTNCVSIDDNHADGFQSFVTNGVPISGLLLENNTIIEWNLGSNPLRCTLQGIGMFDGFYQNLTIRNNVVAVSAYHGIAVYGVKNATIVNNTVVNVGGILGESPWVGVFPHKDGRASTDVVVANNLAMSFQGGSSTVNRITYSSNSTITKLTSAFVNILDFNFMPTSSSGYIDTANPTYAPATDILGGKRPVGKGPDRGAYEVGAIPAATSADNPAG